MKSKHQGPYLWRPSIIVWIVKRHITTKIDAQSGDNCVDISSLRSLIVEIQAKGLHEIVPHVDVLLESLFNCCGDGGAWKIRVTKSSFCPVRS